MTVVRGECVSPGVAIGQVFLRGFESQGAGPRIAADEVEVELNRLSAALEQSRLQMEEIKHVQSEDGKSGSASQKRSKSRWSFS